VNELEKLANYYDSLGREMAQGLMKTARRLPPGMFSGREGIMKLLAGGAAGTGLYAFGKNRGKKTERKNDVVIANQAYQAGVKRGAGAVIARLRAMSGR